MAKRSKRSFLDVLDDYFEELEEEFEKWREPLTEKPSWDRKNCTIEPLRNVQVTPTEVIITVDLPLTKENTVEVKPVNKNTLEISARMKRRIQLNELGITHYRGEFHRLHCHTHVPVPTDMNKIRTHLKKGLLQIHLPRKHKS